MSPTVTTEDLIDAHGVAEMLGLALIQRVSTYQRRYEDMPQPRGSRSWSSEVVLAV